MLAKYIHTYIRKDIARVGRQIHSFEDLNFYERTFQEDVFRSFICAQIAHIAIIRLPFRRYTLQQLPLYNPTVRGSFQY